MQQVFLSRRNLITLLSKLDRKQNGNIDDNEEVFINKHDNKHPLYPQTDPWIRVTALEDEEYYTNREPGIFSDSTELGIANSKYNKYNANSTK